MRITAASVENFKRIEHVEITPDADRVLLLIGGNNAQGKSSLMDALTAAFGGKTSLPADPVRHGAGLAEIRVELDGGALTIHRSIRDDGSSQLEVRDAEGRVRSPQAVLDKLVGARFLDPLAFLQMPAKQQRERLLAIIDQHGQLEALEQRRTRVFDRRTELGRDYKQLAAQLAGMPEVTPAEVVDVAALMMKANELERGISARERAAQEVVLVKRSLEAAQARVARLEAELARVAEELESAEADVVGYTNALETKSQEVEKIAVPDPGKLAEIRKRIQDASNHNFNVGKDQAAAKQRAELVTKVAAAAEKVEGLSVELKRIDGEKAAFLEANPLPVAGLDVGADGLRFNDVPLAQASGAEQLRVALALSIAASPKLRDVWVRDGALLDDNSLELLRAEAERAGCRCWVERVSDRDADAIIIHDGRVVRDPTRSVA